MVWNVSAGVLLLAALAVASAAVNGQRLSAPVPPSGAGFLTPEMMRVMARGVMNQLAGGPQPRAPMPLPAGGMAPQKRGGNRQLMFAAPPNEEQQVRAAQLFTNELFNTMGLEPPKDDAYNWLSSMMSDAIVEANQRMAVGAPAPAVAPPQFLPHSVGLMRMPSPVKKLSAPPQAPQVSSTTPASTTVTTPTSTTPKPVVKAAGKPTKRSFEAEVATAPAPAQMVVPPPVQVPTMRFPMSGQQQPLSLVKLMPAPPAVDPRFGANMPLPIMFRWG